METRWNYKAHTLTFRYFEFIRSRNVHREIPDSSASDRDATVAPTSYFGKRGYPVEGVI